MLPVNYLEIDIRHISIAYRISSLYLLEQQRGVTLLRTGGKRDSLEASNVAEREPLHVCEFSRLRLATYTRYASNYES